MKENEYTKQAKDFLQKANAKMTIEFAGRSINYAWEEKEQRNTYNVVITTPRGSMSFMFWDSLNNTKISLGFESWMMKEKRINPAGLTLMERSSYERKYKALKAEAVPTEYDILACLTKYDPYTFENFCSEYGYDTDSMKANKTYYAVLEEYRNIERIFTAEQLEELREIN